MMTRSQLELVLIALVSVLFVVVLSTKESTLKDAALMKTELNTTVEKLTEMGFKGINDRLIEIERNLSDIVEQLQMQTDPHNISQLEMHFLRLKTQLFYEQIAIDNDVKQAENLDKRAEVLLDQLKVDINLLEAHNMSGEAEILRIDTQQLQLFRTILSKEKSREPLRYIETLIASVERNIERKLNSVELELKRLKS